MIRVALFALLAGGACGRVVVPRPALERADLAVGAGELGGGGGGECCECDQRDDRGDLLDLCVLPCELCQAAHGHRPDAAIYRPRVDFAAVADGAACLCVGAGY